MMELRIKCLMMVREAVCDDDVDYSINGDDVTGAVLGDDGNVVEAVVDGDVDDSVNGDDGTDAVFGDGDDVGDSLNGCSGWISESSDRAETVGDVLNSGNSVVGEDVVVNGYATGSDVIDSGDGFESGDTWRRSDCESEGENSTIIIDSADEMAVERSTLQTRNTQ